MARARPSPQPDGALGVEAEPFERALAGEVGEEHPRRQVLGADGEDRGAHVAEDAVHAFIFRVARDPFGCGDLVLGQTRVIARSADTLDQLGALAGELAQQEAPAAAGDVDILAADAVQQRGFGLADVERRADLLAGLLGDPADLDHDGAVVDLEAVDVVGGGPAADLVEPFHHQRAVAAMRQPCGREQAARSGSDDDDVELCCAHQDFLQGSIGAR